MRATRSKPKQAMRNRSISDKYAYACLLAIIIAGLSIAAYFYSGPYYQFDDGQYIVYARQIIAGNFSMTQDPHAFGYLMPSLVAASFVAFGAGPLTAILPSLVEYVIIIILAFLIGRELFSKEAGLAASFLIIITPTIFGYATRVLPDMLIGMLAGVALYVFVIGIKGGKKSTATILASGFIFGMIIFVKIGGAMVILPALIGVVLFYREHAARFTAGMAASLMLYFASFYVLSGGQLSLLSEYSSTQAALVPHGTLLINFITMLDMVAGPVEIYQVYPIGLTLLLAFVGTYLAFKRRDLRLQYIAFIFWFVFFYLFYGTESLAQYTFITAVNRYLIAVSIPMALLAGYVLADVYSTCGMIGGKRLAVFVLIVLILLTIVSNVPAYADLYSFKAYILGMPVPPNFYG